MTESPVNHSQAVEVIAERRAAIGNRRREPDAASTATGFTALWRLTG